MYAVIFKATIKNLDQAYLDTAKTMRDKAQNQYGCVDFTSITKNNQKGISEITISYWKTLEQITAWKNDSEHLLAQERGKSEWYSSYEVDIVEVIKTYKMYADI